MKNMYLVAAAMAGLMLAGEAQAVSLTSADVTGPSGTIWTTRQTGNYTLFLQSPGLGNFLNPNDELINRPAVDGMNKFLLAGEGFTPGTNVDSDAIYTLTLGFDDGTSLSGTYVPLTNTFTGASPVVSGGVTYTLTEFSYRRNLGDSVSANVATPGGDGNDYSGNFTYTAVAAMGAVPEPATWAMMIGGIGAVGGSLRTRRSKTKVTYA